jgi:CheY-like chemotaxis protein
MTAPKRPVGYINRVLIVEDDLALAELLAEVLTFENCTADLASNGLEALDRLRVFDYEAIVCDLMLPCVDGRALYRDAARLYPHLAQKFLFVTGQAADQAGLTDFISRTGNALLKKPFDIEHLRSALRELFAR